MGGWILNTAQPDVSARRMLVNTIVAGLVSFLNMLVNFAVLAVAKRALGDVGLGVWALAAGFLALAPLVDFGLGAALGVIIARAGGGGDRRTVHEAMAAYVATAWPLAIGVAVAGVAAAPFLAQALVRDPAWASEAASLFAWVFATIGWQVAASLIGGVLVGYQRLAEFRLASGCWQLIRGVGVIVFMRAHASLGWVGLWWFAGSVGLAAHALWLWRRYVPIHWRWVRPAGNAVRMLWGVALPLQINRMGGAMLGQVDKFVLAVWLGATAAGAYELAARLAGLVTLMPGLMLAAVAPAVAAMGREDRRTQRVVIVSSRYLHLAVFPLATFLWTEAAPILHAWVGETDKAVIAAARVLVLAFALLAVQQPLANTLIGIGKERIVLRFSLLVVLLNLPMSIALVARFGLLGAAWATALVVALAAASFFAVALRSSALPWRAWAEAWWRPALALVPMIAWAQTWPEARSWADIAGAFASGVAIYLAAAWFARAITVQDWRMIRAALEKR